MTYLDVIRKSADPAFGCDPDCRIVAWNAAAERLFGISAADAIGRPSHDLLNARDAFGNSFCGCVLQPLIRRGEMTRNQVLFYSSGSRPWVRVWMCMLAMPLPAGPGFVQLCFLKPLPSAEPEREALAEHGPSRRANGTRLDSVPGAEQLTTREAEVLQLMTEGSGVKETADALSISTATVRNHTQSLLRKLKVHSRLEAIALVLRHGT